MKNNRKWAGNMLVMLSLLCGTFLFAGTRASAAGPVELPPDGTWKGQEIAADEDELWWELNVPSDGKVELTVQAYRKHTYIRLYDQDQSEFSAARLQINDGSDTTPGEGKRTWYLSKGIYYLKAGDHLENGFGGAGNVRMKAAVTSANTTEKEPNNSWNEAMTLEAGKTVRGILTDYVDREDFYRIQIASKGEVTFRLVAMLEGATLEVYDKDYKQVLKETVYGGTETSPKTGTWNKEMEPGDYYLKIMENYENKDPSGIYELEWTQVVPVTSISLDKKELTLTKKGQQVQLKETVLPIDATNKKVTWNSNDSTVATVHNGKVTAVSDGTAIITATTEDGGFQAECKVKVEIPNLADAALTIPKATYAYTGKSIKPPVTVTYKGARLKEGTDYSVSYQNNVKTGVNASITVTGKGGYAGRKTIYFSIKIDTKKTYTVGSLKYKITSLSKKTAQVSGVKSTSKASITIPATVRILGDTYKIDRIQAKAFQKNKKLKTLAIGRNIKTIDAKAFYGCSKLSKIQVKSQVLQKVGSNALKGTKKNIRIELPKNYFEKYKKFFEKKGQKNVKFVKK